MTSGMIAVSYKSVKLPNNGDCLAIQIFYLYNLKRCTLLAEIAIVVVVVS